MQSKCHEEQEFILVNKAGIHAEPAGKFVNVTRKYKSEIQVQAKGKLVDAKSMKLSRLVDTFFSLNFSPMQFA